MTKLQSHRNGYCSAAATRIWCFRKKDETVTRDARVSHTDFSRTVCFIPAADFCILAAAP
jgi:hypothetical protein